MRHIMLFLVLLAVAIPVLTGCSKYSYTENDMKNIEERDYATVLLIMESEEEAEFHFILGIAQEKKVGEKSMTEETSEWDCDNLRDLAKAYSLVKGKDLSLSHLKVILISEKKEVQADGGDYVVTNTGGKEEYMETLLYMLDENEEIAKTCPVLQLLDPKILLEYLKEEDKPVGNYFESLVRERERQGQDVTWLKDYLKALKEQIPMERFILRHVDEGWTIDKEDGQCYINSSTGQ